MGWTHDTSSDFEWYTRDDMKVGAMRGRNADGEWSRWTIAHVADGYPASDDNEYRYFGSLEAAKQAAVDFAARAAGSEETAATRFATVRTADGEEIELSGDSVEGMAAELASYGDDDLSATVRDEQGSVRGWIHGDGTWRAQ